MTHPFIGPVTDLTMEELQGKISDLNGKLHFASRMAKWDMANQIKLAIATYQDEYQKRQQEIWDKTFNKTKDKVKID